MKKQTHNLPFIIILGLILVVVSSCREIISDPASRSFYFIDNQSSLVLSYDMKLTFSHPDSTVVIPIGLSTEIQNESTIGTSGIDPADLFLELQVDHGNIYLYTDSMGVRVEALQLNANPDLNWVEEKQGGNVFHYTLEVRDDMLDL